MYRDMFLTFIFLNLFTKTLIEQTVKTHFDLDILSKLGIFSWN